MARALLAALLCWPALAPAFGGTQVTWLGGTLPYDTVPKLEADPKLLLRAGSGGPELGAELGAGLTDWLMVGGQWVSVPDAGSDGRAELRVKLLPEPFKGLGLAAAAGAELPEGEAARPYATAIAAWEGFDSCLTANVTWHGDLYGTSFSVAAWGPYLTYTVRPGVEFIGDGGGHGRSLVWQLGLNFPGDLSLDAGYRSGQDGDWGLLFRLSFQLFPNPPEP